MIGRKRRSPSARPEDYDGEWTDVETRCNIAIEGHGYNKYVVLLKLNLFLTVQFYTIVPEDAVQTCSRLFDSYRVAVLMFDRTGSLSMMASGQTSKLVAIFLLSAFFLTSFYVLPSKFFQLIFYLLSTF